MNCQGFLLSHRFSRDLKPVRIVNDAVHESVGERRQRVPLMPVRNRDLRGQDCGCAFAEVVNDFK